MQTKYYILLILAVFFSGCAAVNQEMPLRQSEYLYQLGEREQFDRIVSVLQKNSEASKDAALTLGRLGDRRATPYLAQVLHNDGTASREAIIAIGMLDDRRAVPDLIQVVKLDKPVAREAIKVLGQLHDKRATPVLLRVIEEERPYYREAIDALGRIGDKDSGKVLLGKLKQPIPEQPENIQFRILEDNKHVLSFEYPANLPPKLEINETLMEPEGHVLVRYVLKDNEFDTIDLVPEFSLNNGRNWHPASTEGKITSINEKGYAGSLIWRADQDVDLNVLQVDPSVGLLFKLTPTDNVSSVQPGVPDFRRFSLDTTSVDVREIREEESGDIQLTFYYPNPARAALDSFAYHYSIDGGDDWMPATVRLGPAIAGAQDTMRIIWASDIDVPHRDIDNVLFRVSENIENTYGRYDIAPPFHVDNNDIPSIEFVRLDEDNNGMLHVDYRIRDTENDTISLGVQYSTDEGRSWKQATLSGDVSHITPDRYTSRFSWFADFDITDFHNSAVRLRVRTSDRDPGHFTDSPDFFLKNSDFTKLTRGSGSGLVELSYTIPAGDSARTKAEYSLDRGKTWRSASLSNVSIVRSAGKNNVTLNWDVGGDVASYLTQIEAIGRTLELIQDPTIVPDLLVLARRKNSRLREERRQGVEASRLLERKSPWIVEGLITTLVHPDKTLQADALDELRSINTPRVKTAISDYNKYWNDFAINEREDTALQKELAEQLYQENLRRPRVISTQEMIADLRRWWGISTADAEKFVKDLDVLKIQTGLRRQYEAGKLTEAEYFRQLEELLLKARERRAQERALHH